MNVNFITSSKLPTQWGEFAIHVFEEADTGKEHVALTMGKPAAEDTVLCRVHSECLTGDALFSLRCDCGSQLEEAMRRIANHGSGAILYLKQEGRNIGLGNKIKAYALQDQGADTVEANLALGFNEDERAYDICKDIFDHLGIHKIELMTNNPTKVMALEKLGIEVVNRLPIITGENMHNQAYLQTKRSKLGHLGEE